MSLPEDVSPLLAGHQPESSAKKVTQHWIERARPLLESSRLLLCTAALLVSSVGNTLMFKKMTSAMPNYGWYLTQLSSVVYIPFFAAIVSGSGVPLMPEKGLVHKFAVMGLFDGLSGILMVLGGVHTSGTFQVLFSQGTIPITMVFSSMVSKKRYHCLQYFGATVIVLGIVIAQLLDSGSSADSDNFVIFNIIFCLAVVPSSLSNVFKEVAFSDYEGDLDVNVLQTWVAFFQVMTNFLGMPIYSLRLLGAQKVEVEEMPGLCFGGTRCLFFMEDQIVEECGFLGQRPCDHCGDAWVSVFGYMCFNLLFNIFTMLVIKNGSAALYSLVATLRMPLSSVAFSSTLIMGAQAVAPSMSTYTSLVVILGGLGAYRYGGKLQEAALQDADGKSPLPSPTTSAAWKSPASAASPASSKKRWRFMPIFTNTMQGAAIQPAHVLVRAEKPKPRCADRVRHDLYHRLGAASPLHSPQMRHRSPGRGPSPDRQGPAGVAPSTHPQQTGSEDASAELTLVYG